MRKQKPFQLKLKYKFIIHIINVAENTAIVFEVIIPNKKTATEPLTLSSVKTIVGIIDTNKSIIVIKGIASRYKISLSKEFSKIKN